MMYQVNTILISNVLFPNAESVTPDIFNKISCILYYGFPVMATFQTVSVGLTVMVAAHRCIAVRDPLKVSA